jgi:glycosyltransferase involved in cell wall biosynthesis
MKRLLTIGHSYVVAQNRRLAHEMAVAGAGQWEVTVAAPRSYAGDLRRIELESIPGERGRVVPLPVHVDRQPHLMVYGRGTGALLREHWDVVHCWEEPYVAACAQIAARSPRTAKFVFASFQNVSKRYPPPLSLFERSVVGRADGWIAFGQTTYNAQHDRPGYALKPCRVITPGVDTSRFAPDAAARARVRASLGWNGVDHVVGFVGRFVPEKGIDLLARAADGLPGVTRLLFIGGGPGADRLRALQAANPSRARVITGVAHDDVPAYLNAMDILCAPSRTTPRWREQFGRMLIEAMACGVAVVGSRSGEIPHVVGDAGVTLPEDDVEAWTSTLNALLADERRRAALAAAGLARARSVFPWPVIARAHLDFFDSIRP